MTFEDLCKEEPRLEELYGQVRATRANRRKSDWIWSHEIKPRMKRLVGFFAENEKLRTTEAWDLSYHTLYSLFAGRRK